MPVGPQGHPVISQAGASDAGIDLAARHADIVELAAAEEVTPRQLVRRIEGGHRLAIGTPRQVADTILDWWGDGSVDGFNIHIPVLPDGIAEFNREVIPLLQASGAFPSAYDGSASGCGCETRGRYLYHINRNRRKTGPGPVVLVHALIRLGGQTPRRPHARKQCVLLSVTSPDNSVHALADHREPATPRTVICHTKIWK